MLGTMGAATVVPMCIKTYVYADVVDGTVERFCIQKIRIIFKVI
jgi:hypothetical protein